LKLEVEEPTLGVCSMSVMFFFVSVVLVLANGSLLTHAEVTLHESEKEAYRVNLLLSGYKAPPQKAPSDFTASGLEMTDGKKA
jgi:hypothetical protein